MKYGTVQIFSTDKSILMNSIYESSQNVKTTKENKEKEIDGGQERGRKEDVFLNIVFFSRYEMRLARGNLEIIVSLVITLI